MGGMEWKTVAERNEIEKKKKKSEKRGNGIKIFFSTEWIEKKTKWEKINKVREKN
jgi:hypothetical protein